MKISLYQNDLPDNVNIEGDLAIDTETKGLNIYQRDRLCVVQISNGDGKAHLVQFKDREYDKAVNLKKLLADNSTQKIFHYARFDVAAIKIFLNVDIQNVFCTKIASKLARTYTDKHGLKDLVKEYVNKEISKQQQTSDWSSTLNQKQLEYAASDVLYLHKLREGLIEALENENRLQLAQNIFNFIQTRVDLDIQGWPEHDIFSHSS